LSYQHSTWKSAQEGPWFKGTYPTIHVLFCTYDTVHHTAAQMTGHSSVKQDIHILSKNLGATFKF